MCIRHNCTLDTNVIVASSRAKLVNQRVRTGCLVWQGRVLAGVASFDDLLLRRTPAIAAHAQVGTDKGLQIAINHSVHVADFSFGAVVFDEPIGLQDVGADL